MLFEPENMAHCLRRVLQPSAKRKFGVGKGLVPLWKIIERCVSFTDYAGEECPSRSRDSDARVAPLDVIGKPLVAAGVFAVPASYFSEQADGLDRLDLAHGFAH